MQLAATATSHIIAKYVPKTNMPFKCHICKLVHVQIGDYNVSIYAPYDLTAINNVIRSTGIHTFLIVGMCPRKNMPAILHIQVLLHCYYSLHIDPTLLHINKTQHNSISICHVTDVYVPWKYAPQIPHVQIIWHAFMGEKYANIYATYEVASINEVAKIAKHRWSWWY